MPEKWERIDWDCLDLFRKEIIKCNQENWLSKSKKKSLGKGKGIFYVFFLKFYYFTVKLF